MIVQKLIRLETARCAKRKVTLSSASTSVSSWTLFLLIIMSSISMTGCGWHKMMMMKWMMDKQQEDKGISFALKAIPIPIPIASPMKGWAPAPAPMMMMKKMPWKPKLKKMNKKLKKMNKRMKKMQKAIKKNGCQMMMPPCMPHPMMMMPPMYPQMPTPPPPELPSILQPLVVRAPPLMVKSESRKEGTVSVRKKENFAKISDVIRNLSLADRIVQEEHKKLKNELFKSGFSNVPESRNIEVADYYSFRRTLENQRPTISRLATIESDPRKGETGSFPSLHHHLVKRRVKKISRASRLTALPQMLPNGMMVPNGMLPGGMMCCPNMMSMKCCSAMMDDWEDDDDDWEDEDEEDEEDWEEEEEQAGWDTNQLKSYRQASRGQSNLGSRPNNGHGPSDYQKVNTRKEPLSRDQVKFDAVYDDYVQEIETAQ